MDGEIELKTYFLGRKADMVEVVRCKNCQHQDDLRYEVGGKFVCRKGHGWNADDFFCADGEPRKPKDGDGVG